MKSWYARRALLSFVMPCSAVILSLSPAVTEAGPRNSPSSAESGDVWTPEALRDLAKIEQEAKLSSSTKSNTDYFVTSVLSDSKDQIKVVDSGDLDGDGDIDIVYAAEGNDTFGWFENDGENPPTFTDNILSSFEDGANFVLTVDLDGNQSLDIVLCSRFSDEVSIWLNDGFSDPTFYKQSVGTIDNASNVDAGDFNGDGLIDLVVPNSTSNELVFFLQDPLVVVPAGSSVPNQLNFVQNDYSVEGVPTFVKAGNFDGDYYSDLVVAFRSAGAVVLYRNTTNLNWEVAPSDVSKQVIALPAIPSLSFSEYLVDYVERPQALDIADMDGNESPDIIVAGEKRDEILIYRIEYDQFIDENLSAPSTDKQIIIQPSFDKTYVTANFEAAGRPNVGYADRPFFVQAADLNNDGDLDLLVPGFGNNRFLWYEQVYSNSDKSAEEKGRPTFLNDLRFHARSISRTFDGPRCMVAADLNNDGCLDVVGASSTEDSVLVFRNKGFQNPFLQPSVTITTPLDQQTIFNSNTVDVEGTYSLFPNPTEAELILLLDISGSIRNNQLDEIKTAAIDMLNSIPSQMISGSGEKEISYSNVNVRVGMVVFQDNAVLEFPLGSNIQEMIDFVPTLTPTGRTNIQLALEVADTEFATNGFPGANKMVYLISDGVENMGSAWIFSNAVNYPVHTYSTGLPLTTLPIQDSRLVEIGGGELLQDISFVSSGFHFYDQDFAYFTDIFNQEDLIYDLYITTSPVFAPSPEGKSIGGTYYPNYYNGLYNYDGLPISLTELGDEGTQITTTLITDEVKQREYSATVTVYGEINGPPTQPTYSPVLHIELNNFPTDPDGDQILYKYRWTSNGDDEETIIGPTTETESTLREEGVRTFTPGETWTVEVIAVDENGFESTVFIFTFVIGNNSVTVNPPSIP